MYPYQCSRRLVETYQGMRDRESISRKPASCEVPPIAESVQNTCRLALEGRERSPRHKRCQYRATGAYISISSGQEKPVSVLGMGPGNHSTPSILEGPKCATLFSRMKRTLQRERGCTALLQFQPEEHMYINTGSSLVISHHTSEPTSMFSNPGNPKTGFVLPCTHLGLALIR